MAKQLKPKIHAVVVDGIPYLVSALTKQGALSAVIEHLADQMRENATVDIATGEQIYAAGVNGDGILQHVELAPEPTSEAQPELPLAPEKFGEDFIAAATPGTDDGPAYEGQGTIARHPQAVGS